MTATDTAPVVEIEADQVWTDRRGIKWQVWGVTDGMVDLDRIPGFQDRTVTPDTLRTDYTLEATA